MKKKEEFSMKKFMKKIVSAAKSAFTAIKNAVENTKEVVNSIVCRSRLAVSNTRGEGYVDSGVKILIAVVIGALLLAGLYTLFNTTIMPTVTTKITDLFNFKG